jgi:hypothetical protein
MLPPHQRYLDVSMPDWFVLESQCPDGTWVDQAFCSPCDFWQNEEGSYLCSDGGSGLWIRAAGIDADGVIDHVDGGGIHYRYRLLPLPHKRYRGLRSRADLPSRWLIPRGSARNQVHGTALRDIYARET